MPPTIRRMNPRSIARLLIAGRLGFGVALTAAPERIAPLVVRRKRRRSEAAKLLRATGIRDLVLVSGLSAALAGRGSVRGWALLGAAADGVDLVATVALRDELQPQAYAGTVAAASGGLVLGVLASRPQS